MATLNPVSHLHIVPREPRPVEYNASAVDRIGCSVMDKNKLSGKRLTQSRFHKKEYLRMGDVRADGTAQFAHNDREIASRVRSQFEHDRDPTTTGYAGASNEITIQKDRNVTGTRVKWGLVSSAAMLGAQTLGFL